MQNWIILLNNLRREINQEKRRLNARSFRPVARLPSETFEMGEYPFNPFPVKAEMKRRRNFVTLTIRL